MKLKEYLNESSLSRLWKHNEEHDCGAMTAFRKYKIEDKPEEYNKKENIQRNKSLLAKLMSIGYGVTKLLGRYPEGGVITKEESYFIVDLKDTGNLERDLIKLGKEFEQDSVLFIPKGAIQNKAKAYLIGTNNWKKSYPGLGKKADFVKGKLGYDSPIYTSVINGRPFMFEDVRHIILRPGNGMGFWAMHTIAKRHWKDIEV